MQKVKAASVTEAASLLVKENDIYELEIIHRVGYLTKKAIGGDIRYQIYLLYPGEYAVKNITSRGK